ncbi:unnamed protein product [Effrenium voratum]|uniref:Uncharacterized protein n=1 Tax=Effrenium voratum TaxID=2562239 RepID=A0AA36I2G6_9DINO|nr:unnamed protein product [Effrenium voratum]
MSQLLLPDHLAATAILISSNPCNVSAAVARPLGGNCNPDFQQSLHIMSQLLFPDHLAATGCAWARVGARGAILISSNLCNVPAAVARPLGSNCNPDFQQSL